jgi:hypothetical protein
VSAPASTSLVAHLKMDNFTTYALALKGSFLFTSIHGPGLYTLWAPPYTQAALTASNRDLDSSVVDGIQYHLNGASPAPVTLMHFPVYSGNVPGFPAGTQATGHTFAAYARDPVTDQPIITLAGGNTYTLTATYTTDEIAGLNEGSLAFYSYDESSGLWVREPSSVVDAATNTLSATPAHFSLWAVLGMTDITPPSGSMMINLDVALTNNTAVTLTLPTYSPDTQQMRFIENCGGCTWTAWEAVAPSKSFTLSTGEGLKQVSVQLKDGAQNLSSPITDSITLDQTAPTGSFSIVESNPTNLSFIHFTVSAADEHMATGWMRFSNSLPVSGEWAHYATSFHLSLVGGDGPKTIYAEFKDGAGNISAGIISAAITLDQTPTLRHALH